MKCVGQIFRANERLRDLKIEKGEVFEVTAEMYERKFVPEAWLRTGVCELVTDGELPPDEPDSDEPEATEAARSKALEMDLDLSAITGTGAGGRVTLPDVEAALADRMVDAEDWSDGDYS